MPTRPSEFATYVIDQLSSLADVRARPFFGGTGLTAASLQFAMIMEGTLYFVVDKHTRPAYERMGSSCFSYLTKNGRVQVRKYYSVPVEVIEDQAGLSALAMAAIEAARLAARPGKKRDAKDASP